MVLGIGFTPPSPPAPTEIGKPDSGLEYTELCLVLANNLPEE